MSENAESDLVASVAISYVRRLGPVAYMFNCKMSRRNMHTQRRFGYSMHTYSSEYLKKQPAYGYPLNLFLDCNLRRQAQDHHNTVVELLDNEPTTLETAAVIGASQFSQAAGNDALPRLLR